MLKRTRNQVEIDSVVKNPYIWDRIASSDNDLNGFNPEIIDSDHYLFDEGVLIILHEVGVDAMIHVNVLPDFRHKAMAATQEAFDYGFNEMGVEKIIAEIPEKYSSVCGFALKFMKYKGLIDGIHHLEERAPK